MKAAIFDVDGTILNTMPMWATIAQDYLKTKGINASEEINKKMISFTVPKASVFMKEQYKLSISKQKIEKEIQEMAEDFYKTKAQLKPKIFDAIEYLYKKNIPIIVASSGIQELIEYAFCRLNISRYFKKIFIGDKTNPELFCQCLEYLKTNPQEVFLFEDGEHAIKTANKIGIKTILVKDIQSNYNDIKRISDYTLEEEKWKLF